MNKKELEKIKQKALEAHIPIIMDDTLEVVDKILTEVKPKRILEIGTAVGYSAICFSEYLQEGGKIDTIEREKDRIEEAKINIEKVGVADKINIYEGDAVELLPTLNYQYDVVFIDAAKGKSRQFFETYEPYLSENPLIVIDNILFKGYIVSNEGLSRQKRSLVRKIKDFHQWMVQHPNYHTTVIPIGDGLAVCTRK